MAETRIVWWCQEHGSRFQEKEPDTWSHCEALLIEDRWASLPEPAACSPIRKRLIDLDALVVERICSECGGTFGTCFNAKLKCCPDCAHFPPTLAAPTECIECGDSGERIESASNVAGARLTGCPSCGGSGWHEGIDPSKCCEACCAKCSEAPHA